jgi:hypothetical protein
LTCFEETPHFSRAIVDIILKERKVRLIEEGIEIYTSLIDTRKDMNSRFKKSMFLPCVTGQQRRV